MMGSFKRMTGLKAVLTLAGTIISLPCAVGQTTGGGAQGVNWRNKYYLAATPVGLDSLNSYPVSLYSVTKNHGLHLVRRFFKPDEHFSDFPSDLHGTVYLAGQSGIYVVSANDPENATFVPVHQFDDTFCWGAVYGGATPAGVQYCPSQNVDLVPAHSNSKQPMEEPGSWSAFKYLQFRGEQDGPFPIKPPAAEIDGTKLVMPYGASPKVILVQLPAADRASIHLRRRVSILASTPRYLAIWVQPPAFSAGIGTSGRRLTTGVVTPPPHEAPVQILVLNKQTHRWRTLDLPTAASTKTGLPVRVFGNWLVTTEMTWRPPAEPMATATRGIANQQKTPMYSGPPNLHAAYDRRFRNIEIPGKLAIWNLADDRKLTLHTGQEDSEILAIAKGGEMLYRIDDAIYSAKVEGNRIGQTSLVVKAPAVANIHWVFGSRNTPASEAGE
jgi:hypothetical protein